MLRRQFLKLVGGAAAAGLPVRPHRAAAAANIGAERVVVIGGGFAGSQVASRLKSMAPELDVTLIDRNDDFLISPLVLDHVFGKLELGQILVNYDGLRDRKIQVRRADIVAIDPQKGAIATSAGELTYTRLVLATGCRFSFEDIAGLAEETPDNLTPYDRRKLNELRRRIAELDDETIVVGIPDSRLVCPPAPYEFVLLLAERIRQRRLKARILVLDANVTPQPEALGEHFTKELDRYREIVEYVHSIGAIESIDPATKTVKTRFGDEYEYSWLSIFPRGSVADVVRDLDLKEAPGATFVQVAPLSMKTVKYDNMFAVGDVAQLPYGRSAFAAVVSGDMCARAIAADIGIVPPSENNRVDVACYPHVDDTTTLSLKVTYEIDVPPKPLRIRSAVRIGEPSRDNAVERHQWLDRAISDAFGRSLALARN
jgi:NADH dehydrogenase FAD-containing subunit